MKIYIKSLLLITFVFSIHLLAYEGYDYTTGGYIDIESYDHQGKGEGEVEYYDYESGEYKSGYLDMHQGGSGELYDYDSGEYHDVEMD